MLLDIDDKYFFNQLATKDEFTVKISKTKEQSKQWKCRDFATPKNFKV